MIVHLQELQVHCAEGQALLNAALHAREEVIPWGMPQVEDRVLESVRQDWQVYQHRLSEARTQLNTTLSRLRLMENKFQKVDDWLKSLEEKVNIRIGRQSDRATKEMQLQQMKVNNIHLFERGGLYTHSSSLGKWLSMQHCHCLPVSLDQSLAEFTCEEMFLPVVLSHRRI